MVLHSIHRSNGACPFSFDEIFPISFPVHPINCISHSRQRLYMCVCAGKDSTRKYRTHCVMPDTVIVHVLYVRALFIQ